MIAADDEQLEALRRQLEGVEDQIGAQALNWRAAAANPAAVAREAERLALLERQRDLLRDAIEQAEAEAVAEADRTIGERRQAYADQAREPVQRECIAYAEMGRELDATVVRLGELVKGLHHKAQTIRRMFEPGSPAAKVSGLRLEELTRTIGAEDLHYCIQQVLALRLGQTLWPQETAYASNSIVIADRVAFESTQLMQAFERGAAEHMGSLQVPAD